MRKTCKLINSALEPSSLRSAIPEILVINDQLVTGKEAVESQLASYFSVFGKFTAAAVSEGPSHPEYFLFRPSLSKINGIGIRNTVRSLKDTSSGLDGVPTKDIRFIYLQFFNPKLRVFELLLMLVLSSI